MNKEQKNINNKNATNLKIAFCVSFLVLLLGFGALNIFGYLILKFLLYQGCMTTWQLRGEMDYSYLSEQALLFITFYPTKTAAQKAYMYFRS